MSKEQSNKEGMLSKFLLSGWLPILFMLSAIVGTIANLWIASVNMPLSERLTINEQKIAMLDQELQQYRETIDKRLIRIEDKLDRLIEKGLR